MTDQLLSIKVSELPDAGTAIDDLYALGSKTVSGSPQSFKVNLGTATSARAAAQIAAALVNYYTKSETYNKTEVNALIAQIKQFTIVIATTLPTASADTMWKIYLVPSTNPETQNVKDEFITIDNGAGAATRYTWEQIGSTAIDLSDYSTTEEVEAMLNSLWADVLAELDKKANKDGWYSKMVVGAAESLIGKELSEAVISYRTTPSGTGAASIAKIKGRTDAWNQINNTPTKILACTTDQKFITAENPVMTFYASHKYLFVATITTLTANDRIWLWGGAFTYLVGLKTKSFWATIASPLSDVSRNSSFTVIANFGGNGVAGNAGYENAIVVDLTLQYGSGKEPATAAAFLAEYPEALTAPYNAGKLIPNKMTALVTAGFNQWNERWFNGAINEQGQAYSSASNIAAYNFMPCLPSMNYAYDSHKIVALFWYDANRNFIYRSSNADTGIKVVTSPANAAYFRFYARSAYGATYKNDIAINLSHSGIRNGEYEPYWKSTLNIVHSQIWGKLNGAGEMVQIAPYGFRGVGANCDEVDVVRKEAYIRRAQVDLGTLDWAAESIWFKSTSLNGVAYGAVAANIADNAICQKYAMVSVNNVQVGTKGIALSTTGNLFAYDSAYATPAAFKTAMSGVMLDFQLTTPLHYTDLMYSEDGGQTFVELPSNYRVDDFGTEQRLPSGIVDGAPASTPLVALINYPIDLPKTYQNQDSMDDFANKLASALGFTWSKTWDGVKYVYTITNNS